MSTFSEIMFMASSFSRDHSEFEISRKDDGDVYSKMIDSLL